MGARWRWFWTNLRIILCNVGRGRGSALNSSWYFIYGAIAFWNDWEAIFYLVVKFGVGQSLRTSTLMLFIKIDSPNVFPLQLLFFITFFTSKLTRKFFAIHRKQLAKMVAHLPAIPHYYCTNLAICQHPFCNLPVSPILDT